MNEHALATHSLALLLVPLHFQQFTFPSRLARYWIISMDFLSRIT